jgi:TolB protein
MKPSHRIILILLLTAISGLLSRSAADARIFIDINSPGMTRFRISIAPFKAINGLEQEKQIAADLAQILSKDLLYTGYFDIINPSASLQNLQTMGLSKETIQFDAWALLGAELLVTGGISLAGGELTLEMRLFEVADRKQALGKRYDGNVTLKSTMIHRFGDEILNYLTGFQGYFQSKIAFVSGGRVKEIYVADYDGQNAHALTDFGSLSLSPKWSPSGKELAFVSYKNGIPNLYRMNAGGGGVTKISPRKGFAIGPAWSKSGGEIALTLSQAGGEQLYLIDRGGGIIRQLTNNWGINVSPSYSPQGDRLVFVSDRSGSAQLYIKSLSSGSEDRLTLEGKRNMDPQWSPRGDRIAFSGSVNGSSGLEIFTMRPDGTDRQQLTYTGSLNLSPAWSPDGSMIAFTSDRMGDLSIFVMNANGANQRQLTFLKGVQESPSWSVNMD